VLDKTFSICSSKEAIGGMQDYYYIFSTMGSSSYGY
jgi:hypothetical protein